MLIEFLQTIADNYNVVIVDTAENIVSVYDGKDSIDEKYNNYEVLRIDIIGSNTFQIMIYC